MSQLSAFKTNQNPDMVYYDIVSTNFQTTTTEEPFLRFNEMRTNPIINNTGEYYLSIVRFCLDTYNLPNIICEIQPNQPDPGADPSRRGGGGRYPTQAEAGPVRGPAHVHDRRHLPRGVADELPHVHQLEVGRSLRPVFDHRRRLQLFQVYVLL